jgi:hypothetical protein
MWSSASSKVGFDRLYQSLPSISTSLTIGH